MNIVLPPDLAEFTKRCAESGEFASEAEVVIHAVRHLRDSQQNYERFRAELRRRIEGLDRGEGIVFGSDEELEDYLIGIEREAVQRPANR